MKKAYWLWHWGDYEIYHTYIMSARRQEFGADYPTMWHNDAPYPTVGFFYSFTSDRDGYARLLTNGKGYIVIDGVRHPAGREIAVPAGAHSVYLLVTKDGGAAGGFQEKVQAARSTGAALILIRRPEETGETFEEIVQSCEELMRCL